VATKTLAHVTPEVLRWARESTGYSIQDAAERMRVRWYTLAAAEEGHGLLTLRQAERAADTYERPLALLFSPTPPEEEPQEVQFRRLPGAPQPPWPPAMRLLARRVTERQHVAIELYEALDEAPRWARVAEELGVDEARWHKSGSWPPGAAAELARRRFGIDVDQQHEWTDRYEPLRAWGDAVEALGVIVMQDGSMDVELMRGFASIEPAPVPAVVVNSRDDPRSRAFTIVHEFGHIARGAIGLPVGPTAEGWCNDFAGEVLMPPKSLADVFARSNAASLIGQIEDVASWFSVTPLAAAVRIARSDLADAPEANAAVAYIRRRGAGAASTESRGGDYYRNRIARLGPGYIRLVFDALDSGAVTHPTASRLLDGVRVNHLERLRETLARRD
jgi:Zn-dependent peptidase ImmA (M78 family)